MTGEAKPPVLTARRATQHIRLSEADDAYEHLCILTNATKPSPFSALCSQIHRRLAVLVPSSHLWVHCPRASNGLLPRRSNLVGYAQWDARSDQFPPCQTIISNSCPEQATPPLSALLPRSIRFLSRSHTHIAIVRLTASYPTFVGNDTGLLCSADWTCQVV
jgi:hypothetical protein